MLIKKRTLIITVFLSLITMGCMTVSEEEYNQFILNETDHIIKTYLRKGACLFDESPSKGYVSPKTALYKSIYEVIWMDNLRLTRKRKWLKDCTLEEPMLVYNFSVGDSFYEYYIIGTHEKYGVVGWGTYNFYENGNNGLGQISQIDIFIHNNTVRGFISGNEAVNIIKMKTGKSFFSYPVAITISTPWGSEVCWYTEVHDPNTGNHEEFLLNMGFPRKPGTILKWQEKAQYVNFRKLKNNKNILNLIKKTQDDINSNQYFHYTAPSLHDLKTISY